MAKNTKGAASSTAAPQVETFEDVSGKKYLKEFDSGFQIEYVVEGTANYLKCGSINMIVKFDHLDMEVPFCAHDSDIYEHGTWLYDQAKAGAFGNVAEWQKPLPTVHDLQEELDKIWPDVILGIATEDEVSLAKNLRIQIKAMQ